VQLSSWERLRVVVNALTRLRFCTPEGDMEFAHSGPAHTAPAGHLAHEVGGEDLAGVGGVAQAAGDDDGRPVEVVAVLDGLAGVEPDAQLRARLGARRGVAVAGAQRAVLAQLHHANQLLHPPPPRRDAAEQLLLVRNRRVLAEGRLCALAHKRQAFRIIAPHKKQPAVHVANQGVH
jgi:hypothetical protein